MPALGVRDDLGVGETAHLGADRLEGLIKAGVADHALARFRDQSGEGGAVFPRVARGDQGGDGVVAERAIWSKVGQSRRAGPFRPGSSGWR